MSAASLIRQASKISATTGILVEQVIRDKTHPEQGYGAVLRIPVPGLRLLKSEASHIA
ncbi:hypothetical protein [Brucella sp. 22210]|uniref:hypothetical protein n=1 Tax=Brucella sp. 22210 TaxID=3453892 RepID=UPI003F86F53A